MISRKLVGSAAVLATLACLGLISAAATGAPSGGVYIALGDSYTSAPLVPNQHGDPIDCGRSDHNYPSLIAAKFQPSTFVDVSCGSAQTKDMTSPQTGLPAGGTNPPQFNALRPDATLVTIGIGGNDAGLVGVAEKCAQLGATDPNGTACRDHYAPNGNDTVDAKIEETRPKIDAVLQGIHQRSPDARVAIVGYPDVLPQTGNCYPTVPLSPDDVRYIDGLIIRINKMIATEAARNDAEYVDTYTDSIGHDVCKLPVTRWFEGLVPTEPAFPLHPNGKGEASMARSAIALLSKPPASSNPPGPPSPAGAKPRVRHLKVTPKQLRGRKTTIRFELDRDATVALTRRPGAAKARRGGHPVLAGIDGSAGENRVRVKTRKLGSHVGRYRLFATPAADDGTIGRGARARYRVVGD